MPRATTPFLRTCAGSYTNRTLTASRAKSGSKAIICAGRHWSAAFSRKLHRLYLSLRYYTLCDVWNDITAGMIDPDNGEAARMALSRWHRAAVAIR